MNASEAYKKAEEILDQWSGNKKFLREMSTEEQEQAWAGEPGDTLRNYLKIIWAPAADPMPDPLGNAKTKPWAELFRFENKYPKPKGIMPTDREPAIEMEGAQPGACIRVNSDDLLQAAIRCNKIIDKRGRIPILHNLRLSTGNDSLHLISTNLEKWESQSCRAVVETPGIMVLPARRLIDICKGYSGAIIEIKWYPERKAAVISHLKSKFMLLGFDSQDFPYIPDFITFENTFTEPEQEPAAIPGPSPKPEPEPQPALAKHIVFVQFGNRWLPVQYAA